MLAAANNHLGSTSYPSSDAQDLGDLGVCLEARRSAEIITLSEERSQQAAHILKERYLSKRPLTRAGRMLRCQDNTCSSTRPDFMKDSQKSKGNALWKKAADVLPALEWIPSITCQSFRADLIAGITVGVMVIPQSMSYANIAGLEYIYGMYAACVPAFIYAFLGQSRQLAVGPVAMVSLLMNTGITGLLNDENCKGFLDAPGGHLEVCPEVFTRYSILTAAIAGVMQILARIFKLGFLVSFLGHPVTSGFTSAAAIIIGLSQVKYMFGFDIEKSQQIYVTIAAIIRKLPQTKLMTLLLGVIWFTFLFVSKKMSAKYKKRLSWLGPMAPLLSCVAGILLLWACTPLREQFDVKVVKEIPAGIFPPSLDMWRVGDVMKCLPTACVVCMIGYMESIAIGKNLAAKHGYEINPGQELLALGAANLIGAMFSCYPVTGSFSRSAVSNATGAVSQLAGLVTSLVMLCTLLFLTPFFYYLPHYVLAAIVISSVIPLVAYQEAMRLWKISKGDFLLWMAAFIGTLFLGVLIGIALAVVLSLVIVIYESVRPQIMILWRVPGTTIYRNVKQESNGAFIPNVLIARIGSSLYFANASFVKDMLLGYVEDVEDINQTKYLILEMTPVVSIDSTAVHIIEDIVNDFRGRDIQVAFAMVGNRVEKTLRRAKLMDLIGERWFFPTVNEAVVGCLRHREARQALGHIRQLSEGNCDDLAGGPAPRKSSARGEIGFSNDLHHSCTTIMIHLTEDIPMIMSDIAAVFRRNNLYISRAEVDTIDNNGRNSGAKHVYYVGSHLHRGKLTEEEREDIQKELAALLDQVPDVESGACAIAAAAADAENMPPSAAVLSPMADEEAARRSSASAGAVLGG